MLTHFIKCKSITVIFSLLFLVIGCQNGLDLGSTELVNPEDLYSDQHFPTYKNYTIETETDIFLLDDDMRLMVKNKLKPIKDTRKRSIKLLEHIFDQSNIALAYSSGANVTAREAYHNRQANCLSLTIMAYALAKEANLNIDFQEVNIPEYWVRDGEHNMLSGHINLLVNTNENLHNLILFGSKVLIIDFDTAISQKSFPAKVINKKTVMAMYYSNKGGQALFAKNFDKAYAYFKAATKIDVNYSPAWGNLGVLYRKTQHDKDAMSNYRYAINIDNKNYNAMSNMSIILNEQGKLDEVKHIKTILHKKRNKNPYYHALLADKSFYHKDNIQALKHYRRALILAHNVHEFHFGMAKVYFAMNDYQRAENSLKKAIIYNKNTATDQRYIAKMSIIKQTSKH